MSVHIASGSDGRIVFIPVDLVILVNDIYCCQCHPLIPTAGRALGYTCA